ncbi:hypothetical protein [Flavobacterium sp.]|uniref:hypothetical protein n=1 Tax=Flavobacterium sp. TaxID=239 RepID=UPI003D2DAC03
MKLTKTLFLLFVINLSLAQKKETINVPKGIVYNYCDNKIIEKAKKLITDNLSENSDYRLLQNNLIIGPILWKSLKVNEKIEKIEKGKVQFHVDDLILDGKMSQDINDSKIIWDEFKKLVSDEYTIRKANEQELKYYWSVISFDIDEPLLIIETKEHNYILNFLKKDLKLMWLDEAPNSKENKEKLDNDVVKYQNGKEVNSNSKGIKETKLEQVVLLNTDEELKKNSSFEDIKSIVDKTNLIFDELFKNSEKPGKIMVEFEIKKDKNVIQFSVRDELDLEIMKEFEKRVNNEKYPNSKKSPIKLQLIYKVNSYNETE